MVGSAILENGRVRDWRNGIGHLQQRGDATHRGRRRGVREVLLVGQPGIARMDVRVDEAREDQQSTRVQLGVDRPFGRVCGSIVPPSRRHRPRLTRRGHQRSILDFQAHRARQDGSQPGSVEYANAADAQCVIDDTFPA
jgi:hypothetical protein